MAYGLQLFDKNGANIMDTNERFTRVYGSYPNNVIQGTRYTGTSRYLELTTFTQDVVVSLPPGITKWVPIVVSTEMVVTGGGRKNHKYDWTDEYEGTGDYVFIHIAYGWAENLDVNMMYASGNTHPFITASAGTANGGPVARFSWRYCAAFRGRYEFTGHTDNIDFYVEKKLTYTFIVVGY
jgi:hypothetical protein